MEPYTNGMMFPHFRPINFRDYRTNLPTAYDASLTTYQQMVNVIKFCNEIGVLNQDMANNWNMLLSWIETNGVDEAVTGLLNQWVVDGTMAKILDKTALKDINKKLDTLAIKHDKDANETKKYAQELFDTASKAISQLDVSLRAYTDSKVKDLQDILKSYNGSPSKWFETLGKLKEAYPNGAEGVFGVSVNADNTPHIYYWLNNQWFDGGSYNKGSLGVGTVKPSNLMASSQKAILYTSEIVYDVPTKTMTISGKPTARIYWNEQSDLTNDFYTLPENGVSVVNATTGTSFKLIFDIEEKKFSVKNWGSALLSTETFVMGVTIINPNYPQKYTTVGHNANNFFITTSNGLKLSTTNTNMFFPNVRVVTDGAAKPYVSTADKKLVFPKTQYGYNFYIGTQAYINAIPSEGLELDLSVINSGTAWLMVYDTISKTIKLEDGSHFNNHNNESGLLATIRFDNTSAIHKYWFNSVFPIVEDGRLNGIPYVEKHLPKATVLPSFTMPNINTTDKTLEFKQGGNVSDLGVVLDGVAYSGVIPREGKTIDLSGLTQSTLYYILFDAETKSIVFDSFYNLLNYTYGVRYGLLGSIRKTNALNDFKMVWDTPYTVDGKLYGVNIQGGNSLGKSSVKSIAHRGYQPYAPENTLPAYIEAYKHGYKYVETDVQWTKDDIGVLLHDETINRTARNADGSEIAEEIKVADKTYTELLEYDFGISTGLAYKNTKIPTLDEFLSMCLRLGLKPYIDKGQTKEHATTIMQKVKRYGLKNLVTYISPLVTDLKTYVDIDSDVRVGLDAAQVSDSDLTSLKELNNKVFVSPQVERLLDTPALSERIINSEVEFECWTIYDTSHINELLSLGVTGITNNMVDVNGFLTNV